MTYKYTKQIGFHNATKKFVIRSPPAVRFVIKVLIILRHQQRWVAGKKNRQSEYINTQFAAEN